MTDAQFSTVVTPSGIEVLYQWEPKRLYQVRYNLAPDQGESNNWLEVPSVTTVLAALDKPGLPWWGMKIGAEGLIKLHNLGLISSVPYDTQKVLAYRLEDVDPEFGNPWAILDVEKAIELLNTQRLTVNHVRDTAGDRGTAVHDALELWAKNGTLPDLEMFPPEEQGYVRGLLSFLEHAKLEPLDCEVMVGSVEYGYAGRYDLRARTTEDVQVVKHRTPVKGPQWAAIPADTKILVDLKTSKGVYAESHYRQLEAYEQASIECGYDATDARGILNVANDGTYRFVRSTGTFEDFRCVLDVWHSNNRLKGK